jgi:Zn-dependent metalloprotease
MLAASGQAGALNEHLADAFGEMVQNDLGLVKTNQELLIGESVLSPHFMQLLVQKGFHRPALRNLLQPHQSYPPQPATTEEIPYRFRDQCQPDDDNDRCGTHSLSGVPNRAFALNVQSLGWDKLRKIYFDTMVTRLNYNSNFESFAESILEECEFSQMNAEDCASIRKNFETVEMIKPAL